MKGYKVGDLVRVTTDMFDMYEGRPGTVVTLGEDEDSPYIRVRVDGDKPGGFPFLPEELEPIPVTVREFHHVDCDRYQSWVAMQPPYAEQGPCIIPEGMSDEAAEDCTAHEHEPLELYACSLNCEVENDYREIEVEQ